MWLIDLMIEWLGKVHWARVPPWLTPIIASIALIFTARSSRQSRRSADAAHEQISYRNRRDEEAQASKVAAWLVVRKDEDAQADDIDVFLRYINKSEFPAYNFLVRFSGFPHLRLERRLIEPSELIEECAFDDAASKLRRMAHAAFTKYLERQPFGHVPLNDSSALWPLYYYLFVEYLTERGVELQFKDSSNRVWSRLSTGELELAPLTAVDEDSDTVVDTVIREVETEIDEIHAAIGGRLKNRKSDV